MAVDFEQLAMYGTAPSDGCALFGVGYEDAFERLRRRFIENRFSRGGSVEKFVVGPFGSGKTHFLRQLSEIARASDCVTSEVPLTRSVDITSNLVVYREVAREVVRPDTGESGMRALLAGCVDKVRSRAAGTGAADVVVQAWVSGLATHTFKHTAFGRVVSQGLDAMQRGDAAVEDEALRWLSGEVTDARLARSLSVGAITKSSEDLSGRQLLLSLFQLVRQAGFRGTVVGFDEAEQGMAVSQKRLAHILSVLQSSINATTDLQDGSAMIVYAITPSVKERMDAFPALQQRLASNPGFFDGNDYAPIIDLAMRRNPEEELASIGKRLVDVYVEQEGLPAGENRTALDREVADLALRIAAEDPSSQSRRSMVKATATRLLLATGFEVPEIEEPEV